MKIEVLDAIMGSGKSTGIIKWMNDNPQNKYLYVSPLLSEVEGRIPDECSNVEFTFPTTAEHRTKGDHLLELLKEGCNISFTHSLFITLTKEHLRIIEREGYTLVIDEEIDFVEVYQGNDYKKEDIITLEKSKHIRVNEDKFGLVEWIWPTDEFEDGSIYSKLKRMCDLGMVHCAKRDRGMIVTHLPISLISAATRTIVLTYMFDGSVMERFMSMKGVEVIPFKEVKLIRTDAQVKESASRLINIVENNSTLKLKLETSFSLSSSWYNFRATKKELNKVSNAIRSVCKGHDKEKVLFTLPKRVVLPPDKTKAKVRVIGYSAKECWLFSGTKATNEYADRNVIVYAYNRYPLVTLSAYLVDYGFPLDADHFALSEMIQFIWRSSIRKGGKIELTILPNRMKKLFNMWLDVG